MPRPLKAVSGSQSLERGLDVLEVVEAEGGDIGVREIARRLELSPTIVQRMVTSLARRGYVMVNGQITMSGLAADLLKRDEVRAAYLEGGTHG